MDELLDQFLIEGSELVQLGNDALLKLERQPGDRALLDEVFRAVHTLKGSAGLFDVPPLTAILHAAEDVLTAVREGQRPINGATIGQLLLVLTQTEDCLTALEVTGELPADAAAQSQRLVEELGEATAPCSERDRHVEPTRWASALREALAPSDQPSSLIAIRYTPNAGCFFAGDDPMAITASIPNLVFLKLGLTSDTAADRPYDPFCCVLSIEAVSSAPLDDVRAAFRFVPDQVSFADISATTPAVATETVERRPVDAAKRILRVKADRVEGLAALVDELVAAKTGLAGVISQAQVGPHGRELLSGLAAHYASIDRLIGQLHHRVMALRMVPLAPLLGRFPSVVREMARALGKEVDLSVDAGTVEADKSVVEGLFEPLTHLLRNAVDHGVESREVRLKAGKPARGAIVICAREDGAHLHVTVRDDGRGIDAAVIRAAAERHALVEHTGLDALSDEDVIDLIFQPGFSTAATVTSLSGRGVGMDAVRTAVQRLGGQISVRTKIDMGTTMDLLLPLTISLTKVMVVWDAGERYGVPMDRVLQTLRISADQVIPIRAGHAFNWRDKAVPLLPLSSLTGCGLTERHGDHHVLIVQAGGHPIGLSVDEIEDRLDVALRPLDGLLAGMRGVVGTTVLGNGQVLMVLDPETLLE